MTNASLEKWTWVLIFVGLIVGVIGIFTAELDAALGWTIGVAGALAAMAGVVMIWLRSRRPG